MTAEQERTAVVAWLRAYGDWPRFTAHAETLADMIERGEHLRGGE